MRARPEFEPTDRALQEIQELSEQYSGDLFAEAALVARAQRGPRSRDIVEQDVSDADRLLRGRGGLVRSRKAVSGAASALIALGTIGLTLTYSSQGSPSENPVCFFAGIVLVVGGIALHFQP